MERFRPSAIFLSVLGTFGVLVFCTSVVAHAQSAPAPTPRPGMVALKNNNPRIDPAILKGPMDKSSRMTFNVALALRNKDQLDTLIEEQQNPASPNYHHWLTGDEFNARFGPNPADYDAVAQWLKSEGFSVVGVDQKSRYIRCAGTVAQVDATFGAAMASAGNGLFTNTADPQIPARFDGVIGSIEGLDNLRAWHSNVKKSPSFGPVAPPQKSKPNAPGAKNGASQPDTNYGGSQAFAPNDLQIYYDELPVFNAGYTGGGDCIAIVGDSNYLGSAVTLFNTTFGAPPATITTIIVTTDPGINGDEIETLLDLEWSHAAAPGAPIYYYLGSENDSVSTYGGIGDALSKAVNDNLCSTISVSFGYCYVNSSQYAQLAAAFATVLAQAKLQGQSVFVSTGDDGAAGFAYSTTQKACVTGTNLNVSIPATDVNVTAVGGTGFSPTYGISGVVTGTVDNTTSKEVWNDGANNGSGGGGKSTLSSKPSYQIGTTPTDGARDLPDISAIASPNVPGSFLGYDNKGVAAIGCCIGGTSLASPVMAGFTKLIEQKSHGRLGRINDKIYQLASSANAVADGYRDVTSGNNSYNGVTGYSAGPGYDLATGWGEVDVNQYVTSFIAPFFNGEVAAGNQLYYLNLPNAFFGYYSYFYYPWLYHYWLGFEYVEGTVGTGLYIYDPSLAATLYTDPSIFPFMYKFAGTSSWLWYYTGTSRWFHDYGTGKDFFSPPG